MGSSTSLTQQSLWLVLAETANRARQASAAESAYHAYFADITKPDEAMIPAALHYGRLLEARNERTGAQAVYELVLKFPTMEKAARPVIVQLAKLLLEENPARAKTLCETVQLGGLDLCFGQAVVLWAELMIRRGEWNEAQSVLETQLEVLHTISQTVSSSVAPIAGARYLLGRCYEHGNQKDAALTQFYNVYAKQGDSEYGPQAREHAEALIAFFEGQGKTVQIDFGANRAKMEEGAFRVARRLFSDKKYTAAIPAALKALNDYPESNESIPALGELAQSAIQLHDTRLAKTVVQYTGERFASREAAANALLISGKRALDEKQNELADWI